MSPFDKKFKSLLEKQRVAPNAEVNHRLDEFLESLPEQSIHKSKFITMKSAIAWTAAAAASILLILPNVNSDIAYAMQEIPVIGELVKIITIRNYFYDDGRHTADIKTPEILTSEESDGAAEINKDTKELTDRLISEFQETAAKNGYGSIEMDYEIVTDTEEWFTLKLTIFESAASSGTYYRYYHIDHKTGESVQLSDLFVDSGYIAAISENIREQMLAQMETDESVVYFVDSPGNSEWDFYVIDENQNFYFNEAGDLVIVYDKYETAPGSMGCPEFVVDDEVYSAYQ